MEKRIEPSHSLKADLWLIMICIIWGTSFPVVKVALNYISPFLFLTIRFGLGALFLYPFLRLQSAKISSDRIFRGSILGIFMFLGMLFQTLGLKYTTASNSGFITGMAVVIVPVLVVLIERKMPRWPVLAGVLLAVAGLYFMTQPQTLGFNKGDIFTLICAVSFSFEIVFIELLIRNDEALLMAFIMIVVTALLAGLSALIGESPVFIPDWKMLSGLLFVSIFCTALGFAMQTYWQPKTSATAASVIYTAEPVFAALFAAVLIHERMTPNGILGGGLILLGMLIAELRRWLSSRDRE